jgi:hypothetical protein
MIEEKIKARIAALKAELEKFVVDANSTIKAYQVAIGELENLIKPPDPIDNTEKKT